MFVFKRDLSFFIKVCIKMSEEIFFGCNGWWEKFLIEFIY